MADLKHVKTFESFTTPEQIEEVNEGLFDGLKTKIDKYLEDPKEEKADKILKSAFAKAFSNAPKLKASVLALDHKKKVDILKQASSKLKDSKIGVLKLFPKGDTYEVGGVPLVSGTGGGMKA